MDRRFARIIIPTCLVTGALSIPATAQQEPSEPHLGNSGLAVASAIAQAGAETPTPNNPYTPPACAGIFADVPCPAGFAVNWIEQFYNDGITAGCTAGNYCPDSPTTRAQMAVFIEKAMRGTATWSPGDAGNNNTFLGSAAAPITSGGSGNNAAIGALSLHANTTGGANTAIGAFSLYSATGDGNTAVGYGAGTNIVAGQRNTFLGELADSSSSTVDNATAIGYATTVDAANRVRIGNNAVTQIGGHVAWSNLSDARTKTNICDLDLGLDFVLALRPVSFTLRQGDGRIDMGFVAQDVEALLGDDHSLLGIGGDPDRTLSLRYTDLIAPMVRAIQEQQATITELQAAIVAVQGENQRQRTANRALEARLAELERKLNAPPR